MQTWNSGSDSYLAMGPCMDLHLVTFFTVTFLSPVSGSADDCGMMTGQKMYKENHSARHNYYLGDLCNNLSSLDKKQHIYFQ